MSINNQYDNQDGTAYSLLTNYLLDVHNITDPDCYKEVEQLVNAIRAIARDEVEFHQRQIHGIDQDGYSLNK